jgi:hypothetical protein
MSDFGFERPLQYSAIVVRKLIESWKVTDCTRARMYAVVFYATRPDRQDVLMRLTMREHIEEEFDLKTPQIGKMDAWEITNELLHSGFINWEVDENGQFVGIYVASKRNQATRLVHLLLATYLQVLDSIVEDRVKYRREYFGSDGRLKIELL